MSDRDWAYTIYINIYIYIPKTCLQKNQVFANKIVHVSFNVNLDTLIKGYFTQC